MFEYPDEVVITAEVIESLETARGGYRRKAIEFITGGDRKPRSGWKRRHVGEKRSRRTYIELLDDENAIDNRLLFRRSPISLGNKNT